MSRPARLRSLIVTSRREGAGKTHVACALARWLVHEGYAPAPLHLARRSPDRVECPGGGTVSRDAALLAEACRVPPEPLMELGWAALGELASGQTPTTEESNDGLTALNKLIGSWSTEQLLIPEINRLSQPVTPNTQVYTMGPGGTLGTVRPLAVHAVSVTTSAGVTQAAELINAEEWAAIADKTRTGSFVSKAYYNPAYPQGLLYLWPAPIGGTIQVYMLKELTSFASLGTNVDMPPGYDRALIWNLALELASNFGRDPNIVAAEAQQAKAAIMERNARTLGIPQPTAWREHPPERRPLAAPNEGSEQ